MTAVVAPTVTIHPDVQRSMDAIATPEVQNLIKRLSEYGLAVAVPHMHADQGAFLPLPDDRMALESALRTSFPRKGSSALQSAIPVMWRWNGKAEAVAACAGCDISTDYH